MHAHEHLPIQLQNSRQIFISLKTSVKKQRLVFHQKFEFCLPRLPSL
jgi:hypothetical protein